MPLRVHCAARADRGSPCAAAVRRAGRRSEAADLACRYDLAIRLRAYMLRAFAASCRSCRPFQSNSGRSILSRRSHSEAMLSRNNMTTTFHMRPLPDTCVSFSSAQGKDLFARALREGFMDSFFPLSAQYLTQNEPVRLVTLPEL